MDNIAKRIKLISFIILISAVFSCILFFIHSAANQKVQLEFELKALNSLIDFDDVSYDNFVLKFMPSKSKKTIKNSEVDKKPVEPDSEQLLNSDSKSEDDPAEDINPDIIKAETNSDEELDG